MKVRYLIFDPFSPNLNQVARDFDQSHSELRQECLYNLQSLLDLQKKWSASSATVSKPGELEIHFYDTTPRMRGYFLDPELPAGKAFLVPYINKVNSPDLPGFQFQNISDGVASDYFAGVKRLWSSSMTYSDFLRVHGPQLKKMEKDADGTL